jgi:hypothetical protein
MSFDTKKKKRYTLYSVKFIKPIFRQRIGLNKTRVAAAPEILLEMGNVEVSCGFLRVRFGANGRIILFIFVVHSFSALLPKIIKSRDLWRACVGFSNKKKVDGRMACNAHDLR